MQNSKSEPISHIATFSISSAAFIRTQNTSAWVKNDPFTHHYNTTTRTGRLGDEG